MLHTNIRNETGNCRVLDTTTILNVSNTKQNEISYDVSLYRKYNLEPYVKELEDHDYSIPYIPLSEISRDVVVYISGFVLKMIKKYIKCLDCLSECGISIDDSKKNNMYQLIFIKNRGND